MKNRENTPLEEDSKNSASQNPLDNLDSMLEELRAGRIGINQEAEGDTSTAESDQDASHSENIEGRTGEAGGESDRREDAFKAAAPKKSRRKKRGKQKKEEEEEPFNLKKEILSWLQVLVTAAVIALFIDHFIIANSQVPTGSMETTIMPGDRVIGSRLSYRFGDPERGDIAIFYFPDDDAKGIKTYYVKRIIGMPGDTIDIVDGKLYLNGSDTPLDEPYLHEAMIPEPPQHYEVPDDCYFMLGDNRNYSNDSRRWNYKYVKRDRMVAKVLFQYFPKIKKLE